MRKVINISGKEVPLGTNGLVPLLYKKEFGSDFFGDIQKLFEKNIDWYVCINLLWLFAKVEDKSIPDIEKWLSSFETFPVKDYFSDILEISIACITSSQAKNDNAEKKTAGN